MSASPTAGIQRSWAGPTPAPSADWRFLLRQADLGRVALAGPVPPEVCRTLAAAADRIGPLGHEAVRPHDLAVLVQPSLATIDAAIECLAPGGAVHISALARRLRPAARTRLSSAGLEVSAWWQRPAGPAPRCLVALDRPGAAATVLRSVAARGRRAPFEAALARRLRPERWSVAVTYLAVPDRTTAIAGPRHGHLAALVTPRHASSKAVVGVSTGPDDQLAAIAKLARDPADDEMVAGEADLLERFDASSDGRAAVPRNHGLHLSGGRMVLQEDAAPGRPLDRAAVRRDPTGALVAGIRWLERVPVGPPSAVRLDGRAEQLVADPLRAIATLPWLDPGERPSLIERTADALGPLVAATLPAPFEHGDLSHPNLFVRDDGELVVIDWERGNPAGLPLHDLVFFVGYLAESIDRPTTAADLIASHHRALQPGGWAHPAVHAHLRQIGVDTALQPQLVLSCWTRQLATLAVDPPRRPGPHRYETLWRSALLHAEVAACGR